MATTPCGRPSIVPASSLASTCTLPSQNACCSLLKLTCSFLYDSYFVTVTVSLFRVVPKMCSVLTRLTSQGDESERIETMSDAQIQSEVMSVLGKMYPSIQVPQPEAILLKRWGQDPLFRGSWSNWPSS